MDYKKIKIFVQYANINTGYVYKSQNYVFYYNGIPPHSNGSFESAIVTLENYDKALRNDISIYSNGEGMVYIKSWQIISALGTKENQPQ